MDILKSPIPKKIIDSLINFVKSGFQPKFDATNTATGSTSVTLNTTSGVIIFTSPVISGTPMQYTLNNSKATINSVVMYSLSYENASDENIIPLGYTASNGAISFFIGLYNGFTSEPRVVINFQILN